MSKIVVFAPHPGDEIWGCGGTIARKVNEGYEVLVVIMTDGRYALLKLLGIESDPSPEELKRMRKEDSIRATGVLGVKKENLHFLDFLDGNLKKNEIEAHAKVVEMLDENPPMEVYFTYKNDAHRDHYTTNRIVRNSIKELDLHATRFQYSILHKYKRVGLITERILNIFKRNMIEVDISEFLSLKEAAIKELKSETTIISHRQEKPLENPKGFLKSAETFFIDK